MCDGKGWGLRGTNLDGGIDLPEHVEALEHCAIVGADLADRLLNVPGEGFTPEERRRLELLAGTVRDVAREVWEICGDEMIGLGESADAERLALRRRTTIAKVG